MNIDRKQIIDLGRDLAGIVAVGCISYGASLIYYPAGWIVFGVLMLVGVIALARGGI